MSDPISRIPDPLDPVQGRVDVFHALGPVSDSDCTKYRALLTAEEHRRADRFIVEPARREFLRSRGLLRMILARALGVPPLDVPLEFEVHGRPVLAGEPGSRGVQFNLTHSGDLLVVAVTRDREVGVDAEHSEKPVEFRDLAHRYFSPPEAESILAIEDADELRCSFFRCWTRKEAYLKLKGAGLTFPLDRFQVTFLEDEEPRLVHTEIEADSPDDFVITDLGLARGYTTALITTAPLPDIEIHGLQD